MEHLNLPQESLWHQRRAWFESKVFEHEGWGSHLIGEQASALTVEVQACYCAGAWVAVIALAFSVVEADLVDEACGDVPPNAQQMLKRAGFGSEYQALRLRRNRLLHLRLQEPGITVDQQWGSRAELQAEAERAIKLMLDALYSNSGV